MRDSAKRTLSQGQRVLLLAAALLAVAGIIIDAWHVVLTTVALMMIFQLGFVGSKLVAMCAASSYNPRPYELIPDDELPRYTTLHPMYKEANMIPLVIGAMEALNYPKDKLQCLLVLEERDPETIAAARRAKARGELPEYFEIVVVPAAKPYGKPKACNYTLLEAAGEYAVIFDAEDRPDPDQLRKAVYAFRNGGEDLGCVQAPLVFENQRTTWVSRFLGNEYSVHFGIILRGMSKLGLILPLGGTSNHFPMRVLHDVQIPREVMPDALGIPAWDPYNVTEDADLGYWLRFFGYRTTMFDSWTNEEAPLTVVAAFNQRTRWIKGYAQTAAVLLRQPVEHIKRVGFFRYLNFQLTVGGTFLSLLMAPIFWSLTVAYFTLQPQFIIELFPLPLFYTGMVLMLAGNLLVLYVSLVAALRSGVYSSVRYLVLLPVWWMVLSVAAYTSLLELVFPAWRPTWNKTAHGVVHVPLWRRIAESVSSRLPVGRPVPEKVKVYVD